MKILPKLVEAGFVVSFAEGRRAIAQGAVKLNGVNLATWTGSNVWDIELQDGEVIEFGKNKKVVHHESP